MLKKIITFYFSLFAFHFASAQLFPEKNYPTDYFRYPLNIPLKLNANFGEMRPNHFHMGLDLFTLRRENLEVYVPADGWIAKVKVDPNGFGNAIYVNHPNGYTTLYCHMNTFPTKVRAAMIEAQYAKQSWKGDIEFAKNQFPVKRGEFLAYSGNTGASAGPHVHYEIRRTEDDACLNALLFHRVHDVTPPDISKLAVYDRNKSTYEQFARTMGLTKVAGGYSVSGGVITVSTNAVSFAIVATDRITGVPNSNGIYEAVVYLDDEPISGFRIDAFDYIQTRYLNAHIDYRIKAAGGSYFQHLSPLPGDQLPIYYKKGDGLIHLDDTATHDIKIVVNDANENASTLRFKIKRTATVTAAANVQKDSRYMLPNQLNIFEQDEVQMVSTTKSFYDAFRLVYNYKTSAAAYSNIHVVHTPMIPVHDSMMIRIKPNKLIPESSRNRMLMIKNARGKKEVARATFVKGWYEAKFREFGEFWLEADEVPPTLAISGVVDGGTVTSNTLITCTAADNKLKIRSFRAELDGEWLMFSGLGPVYRYRVDEYCPEGEHELKIKIEDEAGNTVERVMRFTRK
ncbi:MAG: M23 family metallopeptidase [Chitinophagaceae bacterium]|nr:M23 family metallopeptidase [Chitinophagaceae bacterium]